MPRLTDTSPEAQRILAECYRNMPPARKWQLIEDARRTAYLLHESGYHSRHPQATPAEVWRDWIRKTLGPDFLFIADKGTPMSAMKTESLLVVRDVMDMLQSLGVKCALGGSFASSVHGIDRHSQDADLTAEPFPGKEAQLVALLGDKYYHSLDAIRTANRERTTFNVIHYASGFKIDVFIQKARPFDRNLTFRSGLKTFGSDQPVELNVVSPEDVILLKLEWYRLGGEMSDNQWNDVIGVMRTQGNRLDTAYLDRWADDLGLTDLLAKARQDV